MRNKKPKSNFNVKAVAKALRLHRVLVGLGAAAAALFLGVSAPMWHLKYLENKVGEVSIKVVKDASGTSGGSGFHVVAASGATFIMTNAHVCGLSENGQDVFVQLKGSDRVMKRRILEVFTKHDLCLIEPIPGFKGVKVADSVDVGDSIRAIGHPLLKTIRSSLGEYLALVKIQMLADGVTDPETCHAKGGTFDFAWFGPICLIEMEAMETNVVVYGGSSGSATINIFGNVVGVVFAGDSRSNYAYLVPLKYVKEFLSAY